MERYDNPYDAPAPGYYSQPPQWPQKVEPVSGLAIASMVTGIIGDAMILATCCFGPTFLLAGPLGITAVVLGYSALKEIKQQNKEGRGFAIAGIACGWTAIALFALGMLAVVAYVGVFIYAASQANR